MPRHPNYPTCCEGTQRLELSHTRKLILLVLTVGLFALPEYSFGQSGSVQSLDTKNGFRDARFGVLLSSFRGMTLSTPPDKSDYQCYERSSDSRFIGDIPLDYISYLFYKSYLTQVSIQSKGHFNEIFETIEEAYGKCTRTKPMPKFNTVMYYWEGMKVQVQITKGPTHTSLTFRSKTVEEQTDRQELMNKKEKRVGSL